MAHFAFHELISVNIRSLPLAGFQWDRAAARALGPLTLDGSCWLLLVIAGSCWRLLAFSALYARQHTPIIPI